MIQFTIYGDPVTKKNSQRIVNIGGVPRILPSKKYVDYEASCAPVMALNMPEEPIDYPVAVKCLFYRKTLRRVDLVNLLEAVDDILTHYSILKDDHCGIIVSHDGSRVFLDRDNPRTEITILPYQGDFQDG